MHEKGIGRGRVGVVQNAALFSTTFSSSVCGRSVAQTYDDVQVAVSGLRSAVRVAPVPHVHWVGYHLREAICNARKIKTRWLSVERRLRKRRTVGVRRLPDVVVRRGRRRAACKAARHPAVGTAMLVATACQNEASKFRFC